MGLVTYGEENSKSINVSFLKAPNIPPTAPPPPRRGKNLSQQIGFGQDDAPKKKWCGGGLWWLCKIRKIRWDSQILIRKDMFLPQFGVAFKWRSKDPMKPTLFVDFAMAKAGISVFPTHHKQYHSPTLFELLKDVWCFFGATRKLNVFFWRVTNTAPIAIYILLYMYNIYIYIHHNYMNNTCVFKNIYTLKKSIKKQDHISKHRHNSLMFHPSILREKVSNEQNR